MTIVLVKAQLEDCRAELTDLRSLVDESVKAMNSAVQRATRSVATCFQQQNAAIKRERDLLRDNLADRERVEKELRENIAKLSIGSSISQSNNEEVLRLRQQMAEKDSRLEALQREVDSMALEAARASTAALLQAPAQSPGRAELATLRSEMEARSEQAARIHGDMDVQAKSHQARVAELQACFQAKIRDLRRAHEEQLISAKEEVAAQAVSQQALSASDARATKAEQALSEAKADHQRQLAQMQSKLASMESNSEGNDVQRLRQLDNALEAAKRQNLRAVELEQSLKQLRADKEDLQGQTWMDESICSLRGSRVA
mmetsp:Transcript_36123/g.69272  ORF Transcript_36123/g.69272 Transcript_36123/m.69272 type:complete len:316 (+) Transcript_36123:99-1046(+)